MTGKININFTIFGGTGDLTFRKLMPAFYNLYVTNKLSQNDRILIIGRRDYTSEQYREIVKEWIKEFTRLQFNEETYKIFMLKIEYFKMDITNLFDYQRLNTYYQKNEIGSHIFYYAVAPEFFNSISNGILTMTGPLNAKIILEKPFGASLEEATKLSAKLDKCFKAENIYRIDHYLGKEMVRSIQTIRFMNPIFANIWNKENIQDIQISALEEVGVETRGDYYDSSGALKDMVQNHLLQILSIVAMEKVSGDELIHEKQIEVLKSLRRVNDLDISDTLLLGQYDGYRQEDKVNPESNTETFAALRLYVDNERWQDVPFYIRTGKKTAKREMEVVITFKPVSENVKPNILVVKIQPLEGVALQFNIKKPGETEEVVQTEMDFCQNCVEGNRINTPEAYERLIYSCINSEQSWFSKWDQIELSWKYIDELKKKYEAEKLPLYGYKQDSTGPNEAELFIAKLHHQWR